MSGVTVAQITRSISDGSAPASASASRDGRQRDVAERLVLRREPPLADPVRSRIHSSEVSTSGPDRRSSSPSSGTLAPSPVIPIRGPVAEPIIAPPRRSACRARRAPRRPSPSPCRGRQARAWRRSRTSASASRPGETMRLKRQSSIPAKKAILPRFSSSTSTATAPACAIASTISTPGITGRSGKCPGNHQSSARTSRVATTLRPGCELDHLVEQQERVAVRQDRLDLLLAERSRAGSRRDVRLEGLAHRGPCPGGRSTSPSRRASRPRPRSPRTRTRAHP